MRDPRCQSGGVQPGALTRHETGNAFMIAMKYTFEHSASYGDLPRGQSKVTFRYQRLSSCQRSLLAREGVPGGRASETLDTRRASPASSLTFSLTRYTSWW